MPRPKPFLCPALAACAALAFTCCALAATALAGESRVAVAANFTAAAKDIGVLFANATGHKAVFSFGSTGQLYTQITQGAPFDVFLSADQAHPEKAISERYAVSGTRFTYATGQIVLFSADKSVVRGEATLRAGNFSRLAIANPKTAPYGSAAVEALNALGVYEAVRKKIVQGNNIAQTFQFVSSRNAEVGFVALSQLAGNAGGSKWIVPQNLYSVIGQDAVLLERGGENDAALAFLRFLRGPEARAVKERFGYGAGS